MRTVTLDLLVAADCTEHNLRKLPTLEWSICDSSHDLTWQVGALSIRASRRSLHDCDAQMCAIIDQPCYVVLGHLWQLFLEDAFQASEDDHGSRLAVVIDDLEGDVAVPLLDHGGLLGEEGKGGFGGWR